MDGMVKRVAVAVLLLAVLGLAACGDEPAPVRNDKSTDEGNLGEVYRFDVPIMDEMVYADVRATRVLPPAADAGGMRVRCEVRLRRADGGRAGGPGGDWEAEAWIAEIEAGGTAEKLFGDIVVEVGTVPPLNAVKVFLTPVLDGPRRVSFKFKSEAMCIR